MFKIGFRAIHSILVVAAVFLAARTARAGSGTETVRVAYIIPSNRSPQPAAAANIQALILTLNSWYCEQMDRNGFGELSFRFETDVDGVTPVVHVTNVAETDAFLRGDIWGRVITAATNAGLPIWSTGQVWLLIPEIHLQQPDGSVIGGTALGASNGSGSDPGVSMVGSALLSLPMPDSLTDNRAYHGLVIPSIGPLPLVQDVSFPWFEGNTISSIVSSFAGAAMHETSHALGIGHDYRNDSNFHGNLMYNGLRGIRGSLYPSLYPQDDARLEYATALTMSVSRYLIPCNVSKALSRMLESQTEVGLSQIAAAPMPLRWPDDLPNAPTSMYGEGPLPQAPSDVESREEMADSGSAAAGGDNTSPTLTVMTSGAVTPVNGQVQIQFQASDDVQLASALLRFNGDTVGEMTLSGTSTTRTFATSYYTPSTANSYGISVYDTSGNRRDGSTTVTPAAGGNRAPQPFFKVLRSVVQLGSTTLLDAGGSTDPNHSTLVLTVEWDLTGDGIFDTAPTTTKTLTTALSPGGTRLLRVRVNDPSGAQTVSTPIATRITGPSAPLFDPSGIDKSRFISFSVSAGSGATALRVKLTSLHHVVPPYTNGASIPFTQFEGQSMWVGPPVQYTESAGGTPFYGSKLQCNPDYRDWTTVGLLHVTGEAITPSSTYQVENLAAACLGQETSPSCLFGGADVSAPLTIVTGRWGDAVEAFQDPNLPASQPDFDDIGALVNKFKSLLGAPIKAQAKLYGEDARGLINLAPDVGFDDISLCVDAFKGVPYPYKPGMCTVMSSVACSADTDCDGSVCVGGPNTGMGCTSPANCMGGGVCMPKGRPCILCP